MTDSVFVGAGYWDQAHDGVPTRGLFQLDRADGSWRPVTDGLPDNVEARCIVMRGSDTIFVGTQDGPYRSDDGGKSWRSMGLPGTERIVWSILPIGDTTILVGTQGTNVFRSDDDGETWRKLPVPESSGHIKTGFATRVIRMAADPNNPDEIYVGFEIGGLVRSLDGGETWADCSAGLLELARQDHLKSAIVSDNLNEGMVDCHALTISASRPGTVFLANRMGLFRSADKGEHWEEVGIGRFSPLTYARDVQVFPHDPDTLLAAFSIAAVSDAGSLYRSDDVGETWTRYDHDVSVNSTMMTLAASAATPDRVYCAARRGQVFGTEDGGKSWQAWSLPGGVEGVYAIACA